MELKRKRKQRNDVKQSRVSTESCNRRFIEHIPCGVSTESYNSRLMEHIPSGVSTESYNSRFMEHIPHCSANY